MHIPLTLDLHGADHVFLKARAVEGARDIGLARGLAEGEKWRIGMDHSDAHQARHGLSIVMKQSVGSPVVKPSLVHQREELDQILTR